MNMTAGQRKFFLWCGGILAAWWIFGLISGWTHQAAVRRQQALRAAQVPAPRIFPPSPAPSAPRPPANLSAPGDLSGVWIGKAAVEGRGICGLWLELSEKSPDTYTGYSSFGCVNVAPLMSEQGRNPKSAIINRLDPDTAILTGTMENGAIHFHIDKTMGTDINGCTVTSFTLTPFGATQLVAEWQSGECGGGHMMLVKARK